MYEASEELESKERKVEEEDSLAQEAGTVGASREAFNDNINVKVHVLIKGFLFINLIDSSPDLS